MSASICLQQSEEQNKDTPLTTKKKKKNGEKICHIFAAQITPPVLSRSVCVQLREMRSDILFRLDRSASSRCAGVARLRPFYS